MTTAIIGVGNIGGTVARHLVDAHSVISLDDVTGVEGDELAAAETACEAEQQQSAVAQPGTCGRVAGGQQAAQLARQQRRLLRRRRAQRAADPRHGAAHHRIRGRGGCVAGELVRLGDG